MSAIRQVLQFAFGCHQCELSRVFTINRRTYRVCYQCGRETEYSWKLMHARASDAAENSAPRVVAAGPQASAA